MLLSQNSQFWCLDTRLSGQLLAFCEICFLLFLRNPQPFDKVATWLTMVLLKHLWSGVLLSFCWMGVDGPGSVSISRFVVWNKRYCKYCIERLYDKALKQ